MESGATVFVVGPEEESLPVGTALLPLQGSGKVKAGQRVNLRLNNYPDQEFGYVKGKVKSVSPCRRRKACMWSILPYRTD